MKKENLKENIKQIIRESLFKIDPNLTSKIYDVLKKDFPEISKQYTKSSFFHYLNNSL